MWFCLLLCILGVVVFIDGCTIPEEIIISKHTTYIEGKSCIINMSFSRDVNNISRDMARCMNQHSLAIYRDLLEKNMIQIERY